MRLFAFCDGNMYALAEALTRKDVKPSVIIPELQSSGALTVSGEFVEDNYDFL